jgi:hypothetical protein
LAKTKRKTEHATKLSGQPPKSRKTNAKKKSKKTKAGRHRGTCFILMPFRHPFDRYFEEVFKPAVERARLKPLRADSLFLPSPVMADIWSLIRESTLLIADLTSQNANVFYELGLAHAVGKPVILVSETIEDVPFDLHQLRVLLYDKQDPAWGVDLRQRMTKAIAETLNHPTEAVPAIFRPTIKRLRRAAAPQPSDQTDATLQRGKAESEMVPWLQPVIDRAMPRALDMPTIPQAGRATPHPYDDFKTQLSIATSRDDFVRIAKKAINAGIPLDVVKRRLEMRLPDSQVSVILDRAQAK